MVTTTMVVKWTAVVVKVEVPPAAAAVESESNKAYKYSHYQNRDFETKGMSYNYKPIEHKAQEESQAVEPEKKKKYYSQ